MPIPFPRSVILALEPSARWIIPTSACAILAKKHSASGTVQLVRERLMTLILTDQSKAYAAAGSRRFTRKWARTTSGAR